MGLGQYYARRVLDPAQAPTRPDPTDRWDLARCVTTDPDGLHSLTLAVDGLQCGACVWLIETALGREANVLQCRINLTTRRLQLAWTGVVADGGRLVGLVERLGYRLVPFDAARLAAAADQTGRELIWAMAVAGFAAGNVMLLSVAIWIGDRQGMGPAVRDALHLVSALIALPAITYAGRPFFRAAVAALRAGRTNMDVPISIGVVLVSALSLVETMVGAADVYFDSACTLLFFLLIGRVLDHRARGQVRATAEQLLALRHSDVTVLQADGTTEQRAAASIAPGTRILVGMGARIGVDGVVEFGSAPLDTSLVTGESLPVLATPGTSVFAGTINLGASLTILCTASGAGTLLAECVRLIEVAESRRGRFVELADRVARRYAPTVHLAALLTFLGWWGIGHATVEHALLAACAVLIITCPCALALAVPAVQVLATQRLFQRGILLKSATALERLAHVDTVVFDKTGTLTVPLPELVADPLRDPADLVAAAQLAAGSRHPLARALLVASGPVIAADGVREVPGRGMELGGMRLGSSMFVEVRNPPPADGPELWLGRPNHAPVCFRFAEALRASAQETVAALARMQIGASVLSGDRRASVAAIAGQCGIAAWQGECTPVDKFGAIEVLRQSGHQVLMVGDGLNDAPSLAAASVSMSPASAADLSQTIADVVFQGSGLDAVAETIAVARRAQAIMRTNIALAIAYNAVMVPLAMAGLVTPWLAAAAMSSSSLLVLGNSWRVRR
jgi:Cu2+-exporting ATPase